jgi:hypothetical protein
MISMRQAIETHGVSYHALTFQLAKAQKSKPLSWVCKCGKSNSISTHKCQTCQRWRGAK